MAPAAKDAESQLTSIIHSLFTLTMQAHTFSGPETTSAMRHEINSLVAQLQALSATASRIPVTVPADIVRYIDEGRNPDIYTREFVEIVQKRNQQFKGRAEAFEAFGQELAAQMIDGIPEMEGDVRMVMDSIKKPER